MNEASVTVESALAELREMFPAYQYFAVEVAEGAPRSRYKLIIGPSYYSSQIQFWNDETLEKCFNKVRRWKESQ